MTCDHSDLLQRRVVGACRPVNRIHPRPGEEPSYGPSVCWNCVDRFTQAACRLLPEAHAGASAGLITDSAKV